MVPLDRLEYVSRMGVLESPPSFFIWSASSFRTESMKIGVFLSPRILSRRIVRLVVRDLSVDGAIPSKPVAQSAWTTLADPERVAPAPA
jgi:hypothetical protein